MKTNQWKTPFSAVALVALAACGGDEPAIGGLSSSDLTASPFGGAASEAPIDRAEAERIATETFGGTVDEAETETERGLTVYEIEMTLPGGSGLEVDVTQDTGQIVQVEAEDWSATDDVPLAEGFLTLARALEIATDTATGAVSEWELELDEGMRWRFEIEVEGADGAETEVEIDAVDGTVLSVGDDEDDPWDDDDDDDDDD